MNKEHQWGLTPKRNGPKLVNVHDLREDSFAIALDNLAKTESARIGKTVSRRIILTDLATKDSKFHRQMRSQLRRSYIQTKQGKNRETTTQEGTTSTI